MWHTGAKPPKCYGRQPTYYAGGGQISIQSLGLNSVATAVRPGDDTVVLEDAAGLALELVDSVGFPEIVKMYRNDILLNPHGGAHRVLSVDETNLRTKSVIDLVLALKGSGLSRLHVLPNQAVAGAASVLHVTRPVTVYTSTHAKNHPSMHSGGNVRHQTRTRAPTAQPADSVASACTVKERQYPRAAVMQWDYRAGREDELSAVAGERIIVGGEYKNPGWVWAAHLAPSGEKQPLDGWKLCPANHLAWIHPSTSAATPQNIEADQAAWGQAETERQGDGQLAGAEAPKHSGDPDGARQHNDRDCHGASKGKSNGVTSRMVLPRIETSPDYGQALDCDDPMLDGLCEDEAGHLSVEC
ncbi:MAG: hypothetical protein ACPIOQ_10665 [Promethearchaeia archaeon]